jgi:ABC-type transport system substrate-binding protein
MSLAINRDEIRKSFFADKAGPPMPAYFNESADDIDVAYWKDYAAKLYRYDQAEAQNLLKAAGYPNGFSIRLYTWQARGTPYLPNLAEVIQGYWAKIGIKAEIVVIDQGTYASWRKGPDPQFVGQATLSRQTSNLTIMNLNLGYENGGQDSLLGNGIPEFDRLINAARTETDTKKRQDIIAQMLKMASDTYVAAEVCSAPGMGALGDRVDLAIPFPPACPAIPPYANIAKHRG